MAFRNRFLATAMLSMIAVVQGTESFAASPESLRFFSKTRVLFEAIPEIAKKFGVAETRLRTSVEEKLRKNGIEILAPNDENARTNPFIIIDISANPDCNSERFIVFAVEVSVVDYVLLASQIRSKTNIQTDGYRLTAEQFDKAGMGATIWNSGFLGQAEITKMPDAVYDQVDRAMNQLVEDYLKSKKLKNATVNKTDAGISKEVEPCANSIHTTLNSIQWSR